MDYASETHLLQQRPSIEGMRSFFEDKCDYTLTNGSFGRINPNNHERIGHIYSLFLPLVETNPDKLGEFDILPLKNLSEYQPLHKTSVTDHAGRMGDFFRTLIEYDADERIAFDIPDVREYIGTRKDSAVKPFIGK